MIDIVVHSRREVSPHIPGNGYDDLISATWHAHGLGWSQGSQNYSHKVRRWASFAALQAEADPDVAPVEQVEDLAPLPFLQYFYVYTYTYKCKC